MALDVKEESKKIVDRFGKAGVSLDEKEVEDKLNLLISNFKVQPQEAVRTVITHYRQQHGITFDDMKGTQGPADVIGCGDIRTEEGNWISIKGKVVQLWEPRSDAVSQTGLIGDATGTVKFTIFSKGAENHPVLAEDKCYSFENVVTSVYQGQVSVKVNKNTHIKEISENIEVSKKTEVFTGIITSLSSGSGLIKRCPECHRALVKGACGEHGKVEGTYDLRIKAVFTPLGSSSPIDLLMNAEVTEALTGMSLAGAREMAMEALDTGVVIDALKSKTVGRYFKVTGAMLQGRTVLVNEIESVNIATQEAVSQLSAMIAEVAKGVAGGV